MKKFLLFLSCLLLAPCSASAEPTPLAGIFEISHDGAGNLTQFDILGVVDASKGETNPRPMTFPQAYLDAARKYVQSRLKHGAPGHYFTYFPFDPANPTDLGTND